MIVPGATVALRADKGRPYRLTVPWRIVIHTMECDPHRDIGALLRDARTHPHPPQLWASLPELHRGGPAAGLVQCIDTDLTGEALHHPPGTVETNHARAIQVEVAGRAAEAHTYPVEWWEALGRHVIGPVARHHGIPLTAPAFYGDGAGWVLATSTARQRMSPQAWLDFSGVCGHQHVPANDHWDPGRVPIDRILAAARGDQGDEGMAAEDADRVINAVRNMLSEGSGIRQEIRGIDARLARLEKLVKAGSPGGVKKSVQAIKAKLGIGD